LVVGSADEEEASLAGDEAKPEGSDGLTRSTERGNDDVRPSGGGDGDADAGWEEVVERAPGALDTGAPP